MGDIICRKCGEPWDWVEVRNDRDLMSKKEYDIFMRGGGCPSCNFGTICVRCCGTGKVSDYHGPRSDCDACKDTRYICIRKLRDDKTYRRGYHPDVVNVGEEVDVNLEEKRLTLDRSYTGDRVDLKIIKKHKPYECRDGWVDEYTVVCPYCEGIPCDLCNGTGDYVKPPWIEDTIKQYEYSIFNETDEDPIQWLF